MLDAVLWSNNDNNKIMHIQWPDSKVNSQIQIWNFKWRLWLKSEQQRPAVGPSMRSLFRAGQRAWRPTYVASGWRSCCRALRRHGWSGRRSSLLLDGSAATPRFPPLLRPWFSLHRNASFLCNMSHSWKYCTHESVPVTLPAELICSSCVWKQKGEKSTHTGWSSEHLFLMKINLFNSHLTCTRRWLRIKWAKGDKTRRT